MSVISKLGTNYAVIAPPGVSANQKALNDIAAAAGNDAPPTLITLSTQAQELSTFASKLVGLTTANSTFEQSRGLSADGTAQDDLKTAYKNASQRVTLAGIRANSNQTGPTTSLFGSSISTVADFLTKANEDAAQFNFTSDGSSNSGNDSSGIFKALAASYKAKNAAFAKALHLQTGQTSKADPYSRKITTKYSANGNVQLDVKESALKGSSIDVAISKGLVPNDKISLVTTVAAGHATPTNQGVSVKVKTGDQNAVVALDTRDPYQEDTRTSSVDITTGNGSNVVYLAGTNDSTIRTGSGDSIVVAEGNSTILAGSGNDFLVGNNVSGGAGNDTIFASSFAYGGDGNDTITLFSVTNTPADDKNLPIAIGGNGNDTIIADVKANVIGGSGNDTIVLRQGGSVSSGDGVNKVTAEGSAEVTLGNGNNDVFLAAGGSATVGNGKNTLSASTFASFTVGKGNNQIQLQGGGNLNYTVGGGSNQVLIGALPYNDKTNIGKPNTITVTGGLYADFALNTTSVGFNLAENAGTGVINGITVPGAEPVQLVFKNGTQQQVVTINNDGTVTTGNVFAA